MINKQLYQAYKYFKKHAGYRVGFQSAGALSLAKAERRLNELKDMGLADVKWSYDECTDLSWANKKTMERIRNGYLQCLNCVLFIADYEGTFKVVDTLGGIVTPYDLSDPYPRVIEAELALNSGLK